MRLSIAPLLLALAAFGCGPQFEPSSKVNTLRVFGVQKDEPYAKPGDTVNLSMFWHDGSKKAPRPVGTLWIARCIDPDGDLYYGCFPDLAKAADEIAKALSDFAANPALGLQLPDGVQVNNPDVAFKIPSDAISRRPPPADRTEPPYGVAFAFFLVCAGHFGAAPPSGDALSFPIGCFDANNKQLGSDDFVAGYSSLYIYDDFTNKNPVVTKDNFQLGSNKVTADCVDKDCDVPACPGLGCVEPAAPVVNCTGGNKLCIPHCNDNGGPNCTEYTVKPFIDQKQSEEYDTVSQAAHHEKVHEQMWVRYFASSGTMKSEVRLVDDAVQGWNNDYGTTFRAPKKTGPVTLWAVVQDNRGGAAWTRLSIMIE